jgi:hypothetical protein
LSAASILFFFFFQEGGFVFLCSRVFFKGRWKENAEIYLLIAILSTS